MGKGAPEIERQSQELGKRRRNGLLQGGQLKEIRLYPVDLGMSLSRGRRGRPLLAEHGGEVSNRVLEKFQQMSDLFGTKIEIEDGVGVIRL